MNRLFILLMVVELIACGDPHELAGKEEASVDSVITFKAATIAFQKQVNEEFGNPETSPLPDSVLGDFDGLSFFEPDSSYRVVATLHRTPGLSQFSMATSTDRMPAYKKFGELHFSLKGKDCKLNVYQSMDLLSDPKYKDYLFLPFTDLSNGAETYQVGRYLDIKIPGGDTLIVDFNRAYNPYCAYSHDYSCPIPPAENHLDVAVYAGVMKPE